MNPHSWIEETLKVKIERRPRVLVWVKGHKWEAGNEAADSKAKEEVEIGWRMNKTRHCNASGNQASIHDTPGNASTHEVVLEGSQEPGIHGD